MTREQLEHGLRAASRIADETGVVVIGSQPVLGTHTENELPAEATTSMEASIAFFDDPDAGKADPVDGAIGELSIFHETFGYYAQGVSVTTAVPTPTRLRRSRRQARPSPLTPSSWW